MEAINTSQHRPVRGRNSRALSNRVGMDAWRRFHNLYQFKSRPKSDSSRKPTILPSRLTGSILHQLIDIATGLGYLHSNGVIHGDLKGVSIHQLYNAHPTISLTNTLQPNILLDRSGRARITDFGLAQHALGTVSMAEGQSTRWTAPEILSERKTPSRLGDVFAFGMVMIEVCCDWATVRLSQINHRFTFFPRKAFTGTVPFDDHSSLMVVAAIMDGRRPPRPTNTTLTDDLWELVQRCWSDDPDKRPRMLQVLLALNSTIPSPRLPCMSPATGYVPIPISDIQQRLEDLDSSNEEYRPYLYALLHHQDLDQYVSNIQGPNLRRFVELLDKVGRADVKPCLH